MYNTNQANLGIFQNKGMFTKTKSNNYQQLNLKSTTIQLINQDQEINHLKSINEKKSISIKQLRSPSICTLWYTLLYKGINDSI